MAGDHRRWYKPKLIEVALPLEDINRESVREKSIRHGHPSTLHLWWARRPLAACRAVLFAQLVDDPSAHPDKFPTELEQQRERERLHQIISRLMVWENIHDENLLKDAHQEILESTGENPPPILDPFAGGGSIPLEAQRLGLEAHASDLNPVAVLINKALIEIPPKWAGRPPVFPGAAAEHLSWPAATGLAEDVRRYGRWMHDEAEKRIGHLYPKAEVGGVDCPVIAWIWARTVTCPNPACAGTMPLVRSFWLGKKKGKERYVIPIPVPEEKHVRFEIGGPDGVPRGGTVGRTGAECLLCGTPVPLTYIRKEGKNGRMGAQLMAIAAEGPRLRYYIAPNEMHDKAADVVRPNKIPEASLPDHALGFRIQGYGMRTWADLFTNRQLTALTTFVDLVREARDRVLADGNDESYADAISLYLAFILSRITSTNSSLCRWRPDAAKESVNDTFSRQAISMVWDYAEGNIFHNAPSSAATGADWIAKAVAALPANVPGQAVQANATTRDYSGVIVVATDPPYYDNVGYADLSDYFYIWLRQTLGQFYPTLLSMMLTPKDEELVANPFRHENANEFFEDGFRSVFRNIRETALTEYPITVFYAFKQAEQDNTGSHASTGWETMLEGMITSGWEVTGTWPVRTELGNRIRGINSNALASSVVLSCRPRPAHAGFTDRRGLINALREEFPDALKKIEQGKIAPVDLRQAAIGPGIAVFSRYTQVNEPDGSRMRVRAALSLINHVLDEKQFESMSHVSADTRFCVEWFRQYGFDDGPFGTADVLARGVNTSVAGLERARVLVSRAGKVKLQAVPDLPVSYDPSTDDRISEWVICLHLAKRLADHGTGAAAALMEAARTAGGIDLADVRELTYLLYSIAEQKKWAETALLFNNLGTSWTDIEDGSRRSTARAAAMSGQEDFMLPFGSNDDGDE